MPVDLDAVLARDTATTLRNIAASAFNVPAGHLGEALNAIELGAEVLDEHEALVAELRAARQLIALAPRPPTFFNTNTREYVAAAAAYDRVVG